MNDISRFPKALILAAELRVTVRISCRVVQEAGCSPVLVAEVEELTFPGGLNLPRRVAPWVVGHDVLADLADRALRHHRDSELLSDQGRPSLEATGKAAVRAAPGRENLAEAQRPASAQSA